MNATPKNRPPGKETGRQYDTVAALMRGEGMTREIQDRVEKHAFQTRLSLHLAKMRQKAEITQKEMADDMGIQQSTISKLEAGTDDHITFHHIQEYSRITGERISLFFGKPFSEMEAITMCVDSLKERLEKLAEEAHKNEDTQDKIKGFIGEASHNILKAVMLCNCKLPVGDKDSVQEVRVEIITGKKVLPHTNSAAVVRSTLKATSPA